MKRRGEWDREAVGTLALANLSLLVTIGMPLLLQLARAVIAGSRQPSQPEHFDWIIVPGHALINDAISPKFRARLNEAARLARLCPEARILLLGGVSPGATRSEAKVGAEALIQWYRITPDRITREDRSRHTLENSQRALELIQHQPGREYILITRRYHMARSVVMARNLGVPIRPRRTEPEWTISTRTVIMLIHEAYLLHWYDMGTWYACITGHQGMLERVQRHRDFLGPARQQR